MKIMENNCSGKIAGKSATDYEMVPLNLIYDYPVRWSKYKVLRDFLQNFYDAIGWRNWDTCFSYSISNNSLYIVAHDTGFSYDWLIYIGASTKRNTDMNYAGYFGEGFKIASLCASRDHNWNVELVSRDWELKVVADDLIVDGRPMKSLAYKIWRTEEQKKDTVLCISPFTDKSLFRTVLLSFYYPENPLLGEKIWESANAAVYFRSSLQKPEAYPVTYDDKGTGIIFAAYQALGSFSHPLIFCLHNYHFNDRERNTFYRMDVVKIINKTVSEMPPQESATVLRALKSRWYEQPKKKYDFDCWHGIIRTLVKNVAQSPEQKSEWQAENPHLLVAYKVKTRDISRYNRRKQALAWLRSTHLKYRLVQEAFVNLGYPTLEEKCEEYDGFSITREPVADEMNRVQLLEQLAKNLLADLFDIIDLPPCKIIKNEGSAWRGMTSCIPIHDKSLHYRGIAIRYKTPYVALKQSLLHPDKFGNAFSTYLHELAHVFGSDRSASFSRGLSTLMEVILNNNNTIGRFQEIWESKQAEKVPPVLDN